MPSSFHNPCRSSWVCLFPRKILLSPTQIKHRGTALWEVPRDRQPGTNRTIKHFKVLQGMVIYTDYVAEVSSDEVRKIYKVTGQHGSYHQHLSLERWHSWCTRVFRAHERGHTAPQRSKGEQRRSGGALVRSGQCLWLSAPQAGVGNAGEAPCSCLSKRPYSGLLQRVQSESLIRVSNI